MRWERGHQSTNVEDRRGAPRAGGFGPRRGGVTIGLGGLAVLFVASLIFGQDLITPFLGGGGATSGPTPGPSAAPVGVPGAAAPSDEMTQFVSFVLDDCQSTWRGLLGGRYRDARLVLFSGGTDTACGAADAGVGPFYCPGDENVYIDLAFYGELRSRFGAPGDFAQAYVLAHEIGHHVQNVLGTEARVRAMQAADPSRENDLSVRMELQADCYAGIWANSTGRRALLEEGDIDEAMRAASAVGDDSIAIMTGSRIRPDRFTHGSAESRMRWFRTGYASGSVESCDTFSTPSY